MALTIEEPRDTNQVSDDNSNVSRIVPQNCPDSIRLDPNRRFCSIIGDFVQLDENGICLNTIDCSE